MISSSSNGLFNVLLCRCHQILQLTANKRYRSNYMNAPRNQREHDVSGSRAKGCRGSDAYLGW